MEVRFATRQLERRYRSRAEAIRAWGPVVGNRYVDRIELVRRVADVRQLYDLQFLRFHALVGDRAGEFAINLTGQVRLILRVLDETTIQVEEVADYHG